MVRGYHCINHRPSPSDLGNETLEPLLVVKSLAGNEIKDYIRYVGVGIANGLHSTGAEIALVAFSNEATSVRTRCTQLILSASNENHSNESGQLMESYPVTPITLGESHVAFVKNVWSFVGLLAGVGVH